MPPCWLTIELALGEEEITGTNFDTNLHDANNLEKEFKLKEVNLKSDYSSLDDLLNETPAAKSIAKAPIKDEVRFSDQIKSKIKNLKQLQ